MVEGRLPDLQALSRCIREVGDPFSVRGVEATVEGWLLEDSGHLKLRLTHTGELMRLLPLSRKVQWDRRAKGPLAPTRGEGNACRDLAAKWKGKPFLVRVVGPLVEVGKGVLPDLEVRQFTRPQ